MGDRKQGLYDVDIERRISGLEIEPLTEKNIDLIVSFVDELYVQGIGVHRILKYISTLKCIFIKLDKDFENVTERDLKSYVGGLERSKLSAWSKHDYKVVLRIVYKWQFGEELAWVKTKIPRNKRKLPTELLDETDIDIMVDQASNARDRAFVSLLWDIGPRIGEIATMLVGSVYFDSLGAMVYVSGKTGPRKVRTVYSVKYLQDWVQKHPMKDDPNAPLWVNLRPHDGEYIQMDYYSIRKQLKNIAKRAGIRKKVNPQQFRHSRATYMAHHMTPSQMCAYFGWVTESDMPGVYVHISGTDLDDVIFRANGVQKKSNVKKEK